MVRGAFSIFGDGGNDRGWLLVRCSQAAVGKGRQVHAQALGKLPLVNLRAETSSSKVLVVWKAAFN